MGFKTLGLCVVLALVAVTDAGRRGGRGRSFGSAMSAFRTFSSGSSSRCSYNRNATLALLPPATPWSQAIPNSDLTADGSIVTQDNYAYIFNDGNKEANILASDTIVLYQDDAPAQFITRIEGYPFCIITPRDFAQGGLAGILAANPTGWNTSVMNDVVQYDARGVKITTAEYAELIAASSRIDALCEGNVISTENVTEFARPSAASEFISYYLPMEAFNVTVYERLSQNGRNMFGSRFGSRFAPRFGSRFGRRNELQIPAGTEWNQAVPNSNLFTTGSAALVGNDAYFVSNGNSEANILPSKTYVLFEEDDMSTFFTVIGDYPMCLMTVRELPRGDLQNVLTNNSQQWNSTTDVNVTVEARGARLSNEAYQGIAQKSDKIDQLCNGFIVDTENVAQLAKPDAPSTTVSYYLPFENFIVTVYEMPLRPQHPHYQKSSGSRHRGDRRSSFSKMFG